MNLFTVIFGVLGLGFWIWGFFSPFRCCLRKVDSTHVFAISSPRVLYTVFALPLPTVVSLLDNTLIKLSIHSDSFLVKNHEAKSTFG